MSKGRGTISGSRAPTTLNVASLELNENRAATSYPRTRSQTKAASPLLKRKISDNGTAKASRPAKVARTRSLQHAKAKSRLSTSAAVEDRLVDESNLCEFERTMWPVNVPRSMLFSFRVDSPSSQTHDSLAATARPEQPKERPDCSMFSASGPQAMFDHTWRVMFVEPRTAHRYGPPPLPQSTTSRVVATPIVPRRSLTESDVALPAERSSSAPSPATTVLAQVSSSRPEQDSHEELSPLQLTPIIPIDVEAARGMPSLPHGPPISPLLTTLGVNRASSPQLAHPHSRLYRIPTVPAAPTLPSSPITPCTQAGRAQLPIYAPVPTPTSSLSLTGFAPNGRVSAQLPPQSASMQNILLPPGPPVPMHAMLPIFATPPLPFGLFPSALFAGPSHHGQHFSHNFGPFPVQDCATDPLGPRFPQHAPYAPGNCSISSPLYPVEISSQGSHPKGDAAFDAQPQAFPTLFPPLPPSLSTVLVAPRRERTGVAEPPWSVLYESVRTATDKSRRVSRRKLGPAEYIEDQVMGSLSTVVRSREDTHTAETWEMHRCPLCARTFSFAHSLVIHLKWHWGASSLDWKRGISKRCKTIERAFLGAERRREEAAQRQLAHGFPDMPPSLAMLDTHAKQGRSESTLPLAGNPSSISPDPSHSFAMPIVAQPSFDAFDFSPSSSANSSCVSPSESYHSHVYPPATLASSSTTSMMYDSLPHTPDLLVDTGSSNGASTGRASPTWSDNLFGPEEDADADAEGEDDDGDLFGVCLPIATGTGANAAATVQGHSSTSTDAIANWGPAEHAPDRRATMSPYSMSTAASPTRSPALRFVSARVRPPLPRAPRLVPLRLPPMFFDEEESEADDEHESDAFSWDDDDDDGDDRFFVVRRARRPHGHGTDSADGLTPLSGLVSLHSLPELDVFGGLSIF